RLRARVRRRDAVARGGHRGGDLDALLGIRAAGDRAREAPRRGAGEGFPSGVRGALRELPRRERCDPRASPLPARPRKEKVMAFEALKERQGEVWGSGAFELIE